MAITASQLRAFAPDASAKIVDGIVKYQQFMVDAEITTPKRIRHFMAQAATETGGLARLEENLSYTAKRLCAVWPKRFPSIASAQPYAKNPQKLANKVYGGRLGNDKVNDGWTYRGSGILQTTGEANFDEVHKETGLPVVHQPEMLRTFPGALQAACIYWAKRKINKLADADNVTAVTEAVNGGHNGLDDRKAWLVKAKKVWPDKPASAQPAPLATIPAIVPKPAPEPAPATDESIISDVQAKLKALGYNPGGTEGIFGPLTKDAVLSFRHDNNLPVSEAIDSDLITALATASPRKMVPERAKATSGVIAAKVPEANAHSWIKTIAGGGGGTLAIGALTDAIAPAKGYVDQIREMAPDIPGYVYLGIGALFLIGIAYMALHGQKKADEAYRAGDRR